MGIKQSRVLRVIQMTDSERNLLWKRNINSGENYTSYANLLNYLYNSVISLLFARKTSWSVNFPTKPDTV